MNHFITLNNGIEIPSLGIGTWYLGENAGTYDEELKAIQTGIDMGCRLIDTAEMYGNGDSERLVGEAIQKYKREDLFLVSKVLPSNASRSGVRRALERSLKRMHTDYLDLYLYHWRGSVPLQETVDAFEELKREGKIRNWGVSNFDIDDMEDLYDTDGGENCLVNQVLYHVGSRGIEYSLLPWMKEHDIALMAYCPLAQAGSLKRSLLHSPVLNEIARKHDCSVLQVMLAWSMRDGNTISIPRTGKTEHMIENVKADAIILDEEDLEKIDEAFPAPKHKVYLDIQ